MPIWKEVMELALKRYGDIDLVAPSGIVNVAINSETGELYNGGANKFIEAFVDGTEPGGSIENSAGIKETEGDTSILDSEDYYSAQ